MCSDFDKVSSSSMSSSDMFLVKEHKEEIGFWISKEHSLEYGVDLSVKVAEDPDTLQNHDQHKAKDGNSEDQEQECRKQDSSVESEKELPSLGELREASTVVVNDEDDDGFKTPTSLDHKIPAAATDKCPPAPRKSMSHFSMKRKASSPAARRNLQFVDMPQDLEPLFSLPILSGIKKKMKKARRDE